MIATRTRPLPLRPWEVLAFLEGRKTQLRRPFRMPKGFRWYDGPGELDGEATGDVCDDPGEGWYHVEELACPYGGAGDLLWGRETWRPITDYVAFSRPTSASILYKADGKKVWREIPEEAGRAADAMLFGKIDGRSNRWLPSIHMPRWASRLTLRIEGVRAERLQEIGEADLDAEGITERLIEYIADERASRLKVRPEHWIHGGDYDEAESYCHGCAEKKVRELRRKSPGTEYVVDGGWGIEGDGREFCEACGKPLDNHFTTYACESELDHFEEYGFDARSPDDCYSLARIMGSTGFLDPDLTPRIKRLGFGALWDRAHAAAGLGWAANPWVWAFTLSVESVAGREG